ncbi:hypothetical protein TCAL_14014, partial [Tigriopus californicus]
SLVFETTHEDVVLTRRGLLSRLCSLYDPLGLCAPVTVAGKIRMKELAVQGKGWDETVDQDHGADELDTVLDELRSEDVETRTDLLTKLLGSDAGGARALTPNHFLIQR